MAGHDETGSKADEEPGTPPVTRFGTPSPLHREPPVIEGQAIHAPDEETPPPEHPDAVPTEAAAEALEAEPVAAERSDDADAAAPEAAEPASGGALPPHVSEPHVSEPRVPEPPASAVAPAHRGLSPIAMLIVAIVGAATGFASAYAARLLLDDSQRTAASVDQRFAALDSKLAADEKKIDAVTAGSRDSLREGLNAIEKRVSGAEKSAHDALGLATAVQANAQTGANTQNGEGAEAPAAAVAAMPDLGPLLAPLQARVDMLEQRLNQLDATLNAPKTAERAPQEPEAKPDPREVNAPALAIVAEDLVRKIASGAPFANELAALDRLGADKANLAVLQPAAAKGVITARALAEQFKALAPNLLAADKPAPAQGNFAERLLSHAENLVHVHKIGDLSGEDLAARVARVQDALAHDDVDLALQEWARFPQSAKTASADWAEAAQARVSMLATAKTIASDAMANLAKVKS